MCLQKHGGAGGPIYEHGSSHRVRSGVSNSPPYSFSSWRGEMGDRVNIGVLGLGRMGYLYAGAIAHVPGAVLYAAADPNEEPRARVAAEYNVPHMFAGPHELL